MRRFLQDFTKNELEDLIKPKFRAKQIFSWLYNKYVTSYDDMRNIPKVLKEELSKKYSIEPLRILNVEESIDGSKKYLFELDDGNSVESVLLLMKEEEFHDDGTLKHHARYTVCISSQVGCKIGCSFCLTAKSGFIRNLSAGEICRQVRLIKRDNGIASNRRIYYLVLYGVLGEAIGLSWIGRVSQNSILIDYFLPGTPRERVLGLIYSSQNLGTRDKFFRNILGTLRFLKDFKEGLRGEERRFGGSLNFRGLFFNHWPGLVLD